MLMVMLMMKLNVIVLHFFEFNIHEEYDSFMDDIEEYVTIL